MTTMPECIEQTTKVFMNGNSQAVRLPVGFRFNDVEKVYIRKDHRSGDVILSTSPARTWASFAALRGQLGVPGDFMADSPKLHVGLRDPFEEWGQ
jgi:antitoxin VapB